MFFVRSDNGYSKSGYQLLFNGWNAEMPTSGDLQSGDSLFITPPGISLDPPWQVDPAPNRVPKCDIIENEICEIMGFVKIF